MTANNLRGCQYDFARGFTRFRIYSNTLSGHAANQQNEWGIAAASWRMGQDTAESPARTLPAAEGHSQNIRVCLKIPLFGYKQQILFYVALYLSPNIPYSTAKYALPKIKFASFHSNIKI